MAWHSLNVSVLELYPIMAAVHVWGGSWSNKSVCFFTDNEALVPMINNQTSHFNINFAARHIPGRFNTLADMLYHSQVDKF